MKFRFSGIALLLFAVILSAATYGTWSEAPVAEAAQRGDLDAVRSLLREGEDVNASQGDGMTALHWAAYLGDAEMVDILVYAGANLEVRTRVGEHTPLLVAARTGHGTAVVALVEAGADVTHRSSTGVSALHFAAGAGQMDVVEALIAAGAPIEARENAKGQTPLIFAASNGRTEAIRALVAAGADPDLATWVTDVPLLEAEDRIDSRLRRERLAALAELRAVEQQALLDMEELRNPSDPESEGVEEDPADEPAEELGEAEPTEASETTQAEDEANRDQLQQIEDGVELDPEEEDVPPQPPIADDVPIIEVEDAPLSYGELVSGVGGLSPLHHASREGFREAALALVEAGADINRQSDGDGATPMLVATINGNFDLALELMELGADPDLTNKASVSPLWAAINVQWAPRALYPQPKAHTRQQVDYMEFMERLLIAGADPNTRTNRHIWFMSYNFDLLGVRMRGATPFWRAAYATDVPAMRLLVEHGADPQIATVVPPQRERRGDPPVDYSGVPIIPAGGPALYAIHAASGAGYGKGFAANSHEHAPDGWLPTVRYLVEELGADVDARDFEGYTALHNAASRGDNELIEYLVSKGADVMAVSRRGQTTADMANGPVSRIQPFPETIELLVSLGAKNNDRCLSCE